MKMEENSSQKRRKRRKLAPRSSIFERMLFLVALTFTYEICDIQSTSIQPPQQGPNELSAAAAAAAAPDNQQSWANSQQERILLEPQDTAAIVGQPTDLSCLLENTMPAGLVWSRNGLAISEGHTMISPFDRRFSVPEMHTGDHGKPINYTLHIKRVSLADDQSSFVCLSGKRRTKSRSARLSVLQPPTWVNVVARIEEDSASRLLLAAVGPNKQAPHDGQLAAGESEQITRILVRHNTRLRLECRSEASKPEPKLRWLDHLQRTVQETYSLANDSSESSNNDNDNTPMDLDSQLDAGEGQQQNKKKQQQQQQQLIEASTLVWSFVVQHHHNDHILTCQADHPVYEDAQRFPQLFGRQPRHRVRLEVQFVPEVTLTKDQNQVYENRPLRFRCEARARPNRLTYRWYIDDKPVLNATEPELQISRVTRQMNQREIRCQVSNEVGVDSARMRLSVNYGPAYVSHLLPASLQPQIQLAPSELSNTFKSSTTTTTTTSDRRLARKRRHEIVLARQLAVGVRPNQEVELRCDFDGRPRVHSVQWFRMATEYSIMGNVTPLESEELIRQGALYAPFRYSHLAGADNDDEDDGHSDSAAFREVDYEQMSSDELALMAAEAATNQTTRPRLEPLADHRLSPTNMAIFEPLDWTVGREPPISSTSNSDEVGDHLAVHQARPQRLNRVGEETRDRQTVTTLSLSSRNFISDDIESPSMYSNDEQLNWRQAEIASSKLNLGPVNVDSEGKYVCLAQVQADDQRQRLQQVARAVYLVLQEKPRIISHPVQVAQAGQRQISVECLAQINTVIDNSTQIQWFKDGKLIDETGSAAMDNNADNIRWTTRGKNISIIVERSPDLLFIRSRLRIGEPTYGDFGTYNCTISNAHGLSDSMAINLQPPATTGLLMRAILASGIVLIILLGFAITCLLAFAPQRRKLVGAGSHRDDKLDGEASKVRSLAANLKPTDGDQLDSAAATTTTATASTSSIHGSDTDSLRKSQASSDQPTTFSEAAMDGSNDAGAHLYVEGAPSGAHLLLAHHQGARHYMQLNEQPRGPTDYHHHHHQQRQMIYHQQQQQQQLANGWPASDKSIINGHYQMPSSVVAPPIGQPSPPPLPPPPLPVPLQVGPQSKTMIVESPYVSNGRTYYVSAANRAGHYGAAPTTASSLSNPNPNPNQMMVTTDGEAQFESQYGSMLSNAYRALGYSTNSSPSSGGSSSSSSGGGPPVGVAPAAVMTIGGQQHLNHHHSSGSTSSSPNSMTTYHNLQSGGYISTLSLQHDHMLPAPPQLQPQPMQAPNSPPNSDILLQMKSSDNNKQRLHETENYATATNNHLNNGNNNNGLATHV